jgi:hypothetical protein
MFSQTKLLSGTFVFVQDYMDIYNLIDIHSVNAVEVESLKRPFTEAQDKNKIMDAEDLRDNQAFHQLLRKEQAQAVTIYRDLISSDEGQARDVKNFMKRNILRVSGDIFTA